MQNKLEELRTLAESMEVDCTDGTIPQGTQGEIDEAAELLGAFIIGGKAHTLGCQCKGTGRIPDPRVAPLLEVVRTMCPSCFDAGMRVVAELSYHAVGCREGYTTRSWEGLPEGALAGALCIACLNLWRGFIDLGAIFLGVSPDEAALEAVIEALKEMKCQ